MFKEALKRGFGKLGGYLIGGIAVFSGVYMDGMIGSIVSLVGLGIIASAVVL